MYRTPYLENRRTLADSGERTVNVDVDDPITGMWIEIRNKNGATHNQNNTMAANIDEIQVLSGSDVLVSLDGFEALALTAYWFRQMGYQLVSEWASNWQNLNVFIPFGRFIGDTEYALDPKQFTNLQVRVKWNFANVNAVGATGFLTNNGKLTVMPIVMMGATAPVGLLTHQEFYSWTTVADGYEYIDLPRDWPYVAMMVRADLAAYAIFSVVSNLKLNINGNGIVPYDMRMSDLVRLQSVQMPRMIYKHHFEAADADTIYTVLKQDETFSPVDISTDDTVFTYLNYGKGEGAVEIDTAGSPQTSDTKFSALVSGHCPYRTVWLPFGDLQKVADWLPANAFSSIRLEAKGAVASGTGYVVLTQLRMYT